MNKEGELPLHSAARTGVLEMVQLLVDHDAQIGNPMNTFLYGSFLLDFGVYHCNIFEIIIACINISLASCSRGPLGESLFKKI